MEFLLKFRRPTTTRGYLSLQAHFCRVLGGGEKRRKFSGHESQQFSQGSWQLREKAFAPLELYVLPTTVGDICFPRRPLIIHLRLVFRIIRDFRGFESVRRNASWIEIGTFILTDYCTSDKCAIDLILMKICRRVTISYMWRGSLAVADRRGGMVKFQLE